MSKKIIRLTESDLHKVVKESVKRILRETSEEDIRKSEMMKLFQYCKATENAIRKKLLAAIGNRYGVKFDVMTQVLPSSELMYVTLIPLDDSLNFLKISAKDVVSRVIAKHGYVITRQSYREAPPKYGAKKGCICYMCEKDDNALTFMPRSGLKHSDYNGNVRQFDDYSNYDDDNINLNSPNSGEAIRRGYSGNEWSSSSAMENPWGANGIARLRSMYGG